MIPLFEQAHQLSLTPIEEALLAYLETHLPSCAYLKLEELGNAVYTSNASIVRFTQKLGFKGYHEFKYEVRKQLEQSTALPNTAQTLIDRSLASYKDQLETLDMVQLEQIAQLLASHHPLYIYGSELSALVARYLQMILTTLDRSCILIEWRNLLEGISSTIEENAILFIISAHGDEKRYHSVFQKARERKATIVLLTCVDDSPLMELSSIALSSSDEIMELHHVDINPRLGIFTIVQLLIELFAQQMIQ